MELLSQRAYARHRGISQAAVWKAIQTGRISTVKVGAGVKINPRTADREWSENTDRSKARNSETGDPKLQRGKGEPSAPMQLDGIGGMEQLALLEVPAEEEPVAAGGNGDGGNGGAGEDPEISSYARSRAQREAALAKTAELALEEKMGALVRSDEVRRAAFNAARKARDMLVAIPERVAVVVAAIDDPAEVLSVLENEIERVCGELSDANAKRD